MPEVNTLATPLGRCHGYLAIVVPHVVGAPPTPFLPLSYVLARLGRDLQYERVALRFVFSFDSLYDRLSFYVPLMASLAARISGTSSSRIVYLAVASSFMK